MTTFSAVTRPGRGNRRGVIEYLRNAPNSTLPVLPLVSRRNFWGSYDTIEFPGVVVFNPSLLSLPILENTSAEYVGVAREERLVIALDDGTDVQPRELVGALMEDVRDDTRYYPTAKRWIQGYEVAYLEEMIQSDDITFPKCKGLWYHNIQGPEDGRLFWSKLGEPLLIYLSVSPENSNLCRTLYLIDLRSAYEPLQQLLPEPPIRFPRSIPLLYRTQTGFPKNWAVFSNSLGKIFVHTDLIPQRIYELKVPESEDEFPTFFSPASELALLEQLTTPTVANCMSRIIGQTENPYPIDLHQSSPLLEIVLCATADARAGRCDHARNRIFIMLVQVVHRSKVLYYEPRIVSLNSSPPHSYISLSKPLVYRTTLADVVDCSGI